MRRLAAVFKRKDSTSPPSSDKSSTKSRRSWKPWVKRSRTPDHQFHEDDHHDSLLNYTRHSLLAAPASPSPFSTHTPSLYPRSVNPPSTHHAHDMRTRLLATNLLRRIQPAHPPLPTLKHPYPLDFPDSRWPSRTPSTSSPGLRRWTTRSCFEQRNVLYLPSSPTHPLPISAKFPIAALEYSEHIDLMADPDLFSQNTPPPNTPLDSDTLSAPALPSSRNSYTAVPSPLRNQHSLAAVIPPDPSTSVKRIVRFAEDSTDESETSAEDALPLHIIRQQQKKAQKAKFLRMERLRRARQLEEERERHEKQLAQKGVDELRERERRLREKEDKERRERERYAEEVINARMRRDMHRIGGVTGVEARRASELLASASSSSLISDSRASRLPSRREVSDSMLPGQNSASPSSSSPTSSRPSSFIIPTQTPPNGPASTYSSSSEDVRAGGSRRGSMVHPHTPNLHPHSNPMIVSTHPTWSASNPNVNTQSWGPPIPLHGMGMAPFMGAVDFGLQDMPLLPPAAPFMKHSSYDRKPSNASSNSPSRERDSSKDSSRRGSVSSASGSVTRPERERGVTYPAPSRSNNASSTSLNGRRASHGRDGSGDSRNSMAGVGSRSSSIGGSTTRGRPALSSSMTMPTTSSSKPPTSSANALAIQMQQIQMQQAQMAQMHAQMQMQQAQAQFQIAQAQAQMVQMQMGMGGQQGYGQGSLSGRSQGGQSVSKGHHTNPSQNPWTALPSQSGGVPVKMPVSPYSHDLGSSGSLRSKPAGANTGGGSLSSRRSVATIQTSKTQKNGYTGWRTPVVS